MRIGIFVSFNSLVIDKEIYPTRIAGDILQTYWIVKYVKKNYDIDFRNNLKGNDINHFSFFSFFIFGSHDVFKVGINPNFCNFLYYNLFNSFSFFVRLLSKNDLFRPMLFYYNIVKFFLRNRDYISKMIDRFIKGGNLRYIIVNSELENREFYKFLKTFGVDADSLDFYVIPNPLDYEEIEYLLDTNYFDFEEFKRTYKIPSEYVLVVGRFDRVKNIVNFINHYTHRKLDKQIPLVVLGVDQEYDKKYYLDLKRKACSSVIIINTNEIQTEYRGKERYFFYRKICLELLRRSYLVVIPSIVESFSLVGLEAMYMNKPLIITQNSPYKEIFRDYLGRSIKLIDPLKMDLSFDLFHFDDYTHMSDYIRNNFGIHIIAPRYFEVWKKYVGD
ncbi:MAG: glycosyltransferase [Candidatus Calescibacterium sp.]|nr:glycosyltransferase [Candidatus Calescibacterium sp.]MCX7971687.1 glycosyltransferase [bacterium]MDW8195293.1 glycosyltransferase [Candidatus Calescibacterium sp.]